MAYDEYLAEHLLFGEPLPAGNERPHAVGQRFVIGHRSTPAAVRYGSGEIEQHDLGSVSAGECDRRLIAHGRPVAGL